MEVATRGTFPERGSIALLPQIGKSLDRQHHFAARRLGSRFAAAAFNFRVGGGSCGKCKGKGAIECPGCKGSGKNKKNGNLFERWK
eukprot:c14402_g1_i1 orf=337-594(-)